MTQQCFNGNDEHNCNDNDYVCGDNETVDLQAKCNGTIECTNGNDERNCETQAYRSYCNGENYTKCNDTGANCYLTQPEEVSQRCDGIKQCNHGMEEYGCTECHFPLLTCDRNGTEFKCYKPSQKCNGVRECDDNEDEKNCSIITNTC